MTKQALKGAITGQAISTLAHGLQLARQMMPQAAAAPGVQQKKAAPQRVKISNHYQYGDSNTGFFNKIVPILMGFFSSSLSS